MRWLALVGLIALGACNQTPINVSAIAVTPAEVQSACTAVAVGYILWEAEWAKKVKPATATKVRAGYAGINAVCANPPTSASAPQVLGSILAAVQAYSKELAQATQ